MPIDAEIKHQVLAGNTAQSIYHNLRHLESDLQSVITRWVWELLQNSRDAALDAAGTLTASIDYSDDAVVFIHNGKPFQQNEIAHLIFHGSTKIEDADTIGQYGSGFLTTHLLSPVIDVAGQLTDGQWFDFRLERRATSVPDLLQSMEDADKNFDPSPEPPSESLPDGFTTRFRYPIVGASATAVVDEGLKNLYQCAPLVVSFNPEFSTIRVNTTRYSVQFKVVAREQLLSGEIEKITVAELHSGHQQPRQYLVAKGENSSVAIPISSHNGHEKCLPLEDVPKLFLGFPLIGTEKFGFPAVISSLRFTPTEERNGVYLGQGETEANETNQQVLEESCDLLVKLIQFVAGNGYRNAQILACLPQVVRQAGLNESWLSNILANKLIPAIRQTPSVMNHSGTLLPPLQAVLPFAEKDTGVDQLWGLLSRLAETSNSLPLQEEAVGWCRAIKSWATITGQDPWESDDAFHGEYLAYCISEDAVTLAGLAGLLSDDVEPIGWLNEFHQYITENGLREEVKDYNIVPAQDGRLGKLQSLCRDVGIDGELKNIAELLDWKIRQDLRDVRLTAIADLPGKGDWDTAYVVSQLIQRLQAKAGTSLDAGFAMASVRLFAWLVQQGRWEDLQGFPVFSVDAGAPSFRVIHLPRLTGDAQTPPLAPVKAWPPDLREFCEVFPDERILSNAFHDALPDSAFWQEMNRRRLAVTDIIVKTDSTVERFFPDEPLPELEQGKKHETSETLATTDFLYRVEVMREVRNSRALAWPFWKFVSLWLSSNDCQGLQKAEAGCGSCGNPHQYYPAAWLERVREDGWIRRPNDVRETASPQSLARLVKENESQIDSFMSTPSVADLLEAMGIADLDMWMALRASTEAELKQQKDAFTDILRKTDGNLQPVREFVQDMQDDPKLVEHLTERREHRRVVQRNHELGAEVECKVKQALESLGFSVSRTGTGSDYAISAEVGDVAGLQLSKGTDTWLVEVKATRENSVRMTSTQARKAQQEGDKWLLCVVPVEGETPNIEGMKFVAGVGDKVGPLCDRLGDYEHMRDQIVGGITGVELEIQSGTARFRVNSNIWGNGQPLSVLAQLLSR